MILLDTNVISEMMKKAPNPKVLNWLDIQDSHSVYISTITCAELRFGIGTMPEGSRRSALNTLVEDILNIFASKTLAFDSSASLSYADLAVKARKNGRGFPTPDGYIAAIAHSNGFSIATRDTTPFESVGLTVINPWST